MSKFCPNCGHENKDVAIFCGNCGNRLIAQNFSTNFRDTGSSTSGPSTTSKPSNASNDTDWLSCCCGSILILFIIMLIMSMG